MNGYRMSSNPGLLILVLLVFCLPGSSRAGIQEILDAIKASEFRFARSGSEVPFIPVGWLSNNYYPNAEFEPNFVFLPNAEVEQNTTSLGAGIPVYISRRDMVLVGGDISTDLIRVREGPFVDQTVVRCTPVGAWMG